jgi:proline iminopeptidase
MDLLAHSAGAILATLYAAAHPGRVSRLLLITPGLSAVGVDGTDEELTAVIERRAAQPNDATVIIAPDAGHFPWIDGPVAFT